MMRVSIKHNFTFICMPKCASTSIEKALLPHCQLVTRDGEGIKHTSAARYNKYIRPFLNNKDIETVCIMREPISWLHSWYRYRSREAIADPEHKRHSHYCGHITFQQWVEAYLSEIRPEYAKLGSQKNYITDKDGEVCVNRIFKYEDLSMIQNYFKEKIGE